MKNNLKKSSAYLLPAVILISLFLGACNNTKYIADNDALYTGATVKMKNFTAGKKQEKVVKEDLEGLIRPKPNSKILGMRVKLSIYNFAGKPNPKGKKGLGSLIRKYGEPPVLLSQVNLDHNEKVLANFLENRGFFHAVVNGDTVVKAKKAHATYEVETGSQYTINEVHFPPDSIPITHAIKDIASKTLLKTGDPFNLDVIKAERTRIDAHLKENGYYFFSPDHLIVFVDSTIGNNLVNLYVKMKPDIPGGSMHAYTINDVYIYSNYNLRTAARDTLKSDSVVYAGYHVIDRKKTFNPKVFDRMMMFYPGDLYNRTDHNLSLSRLINLGAFKFVKNRFEVVPDTFQLNSFYYLTPLPKKSLSAEIGGLTKSNNVTGSEVTLRWKNRNTFKGAELLTVNAYAGTEVQYSGQYSGYNTFRVGAEANLTFPRFLIPIFNFNTSGSYVPRTNLQLGYDLLNRQKLYTLKSFRGQFGYIWKENIRKEHQLYPISVNYVQPINVTPEYLKGVDTNPILKKAIEKQFTLGSNYTFNYNELVNQDKMGKGLYFNGLIDLSGNLAGLISGANTKQGKTVQLFGAPFSQYVKTEADLRYYFKVGQNNQWANRIIAGFGLPYGNSTALPFVKQFFVGGNNSLRGFRSRSVGPGSFNGGQVVGKKGFLPDQTGDIKLELNTEFRAKLYSIFYGALFVDAGNIWLYNQDPNQPGGKFTKDFLKELAVDAGIGLRIDVSILLLRLDVGIPLRKPYLPLGERSVINQIDFGKSDWRKENIIYNLAIGLPF